MESPKVIHKQSRSSINPVWYVVTISMMSFVIVLTGCGSEQNKSLWQQLKDLGDQKSTLAVRVEKLEKENERLRRQIGTLQRLDPNDRLSAVDTLEKVVIHPRSGLYDKDNDGRKETLVVYIVPTDITGDRVKAAGRVEVALWNLNTKDPHAALLKQWVVEPTELKQYWVGTLMTQYYRLAFPSGNLLKGDETGLTVKVRFVDYFSGKVIEDQRAIQ